LRIGPQTLFGVGIDSNIVSASFKAIVSGLQRTRSAVTDLGDRSSALSPTD
jgi:2-isopropylmalate synthase